MHSGKSRTNRPAILIVSLAILAMLIIIGVMASYAISTLVTAVSA
jgi:hypothetical protein